MHDRHIVRCRRRASRLTLAGFRYLGQRTHRENLLTLFATDCLAGQFIHQVDVCTATRTGNAEHGATPCRSPKIMAEIKPILIYRFGRWQQEFEHWPLFFFAFRGWGETGC
jgi:hypothetical protein